MVSKLFVPLLVFGVLSTALAKGGGGYHKKRHRHNQEHDDHDEHVTCPQPETLTELNMKCTVSEDCRSFVCSANVAGEVVNLNLKISTTSEPMSAKVILNVSSEAYHWSHTFTNEMKIQVPGFPLRIYDLPIHGMYMLFKLKKIDNDVVFQLDVYFPISDTEDKVVTLLKSKVPPPRPSDKDKKWGRCHRFSSWFKHQSTAVKASIIFSAILVFSMLMVGIVYCCKKRRDVKNVKVKPPSYAQATSTETKVPLEPLVNEE